MALPIKVIIVDNMKWLEHLELKIISQLLRGEDIKPTYPGFFYRHVHWQHASEMEQRKNLFFASEWGKTKERWQKKRNERTSL